MAVADILVGGTRIFYAPVGTAEPSKDTVAYGGVWGGAWVEIGYTKEPLSCNYEADEFDVMVEQSLGAVKRLKTKEAVTLETTLAEVSPTNLALAMGRDVEKGIATAALVGYEQVSVGDEAVIPEKAWGFEGPFVDANGVRLPVRVFIPKGTARVNGALEFAKADSVGLPFQVKALVDLDRGAGSRMMKVQKVTAPLA